MQDQPFEPYLDQPIDGIPASDNFPDVLFDDPIESEALSEAAHSVGGELEDMDP